MQLTNPRRCRTTRQESTQQTDKAKVSQVKMTQILPFARQSGIEYAPLSLGEVNILETHVHTILI